MAALDFPSSPTLNQTYTANSQTWTWNGVSWVTTTSSGGSMVYPSAGIANSTGTSWGSSYTTTGSGTVVALSTSPSFTTPILGTPTSGTLTNCTGLPIGGISATGTPSATTYLRGDGSWATPAGGGGGSGTVNTGTANQFAYYAAGGTTVSGISAPAAMALLEGFTSTATAGGTTTLTNASSVYQVFTGTSAQTVVLPSTATLTQGWSFHIVNNSTGTLTVQTSTAVSLGTIPPGVTMMPTALTTTGNTASDWETGYTDFSTLTGTGSNVLSNSPTLVTPNLGTPSALTLTNATGLPVGGISATGTPSATTYLRGDGTWSTPSGGGGSNVITSLQEIKTAPTISGGTLTINCSLGNVFAVSLSASVTTLSFTNIPASGNAYSLTLATTGAGSAVTITWPASVKWASALAPLLTTASGKVDIYVLSTWDGGTTWYAMIAGQNL